MSNKNVILFQPIDELPYFNNPLEPITVETLASVIEDKGYSTTILPTDATEKDLIATIKKTKPIAIGFSIHSFVYFTCLSYAKKTKEIANELNINIKTIFGGYHPTGLPKEVASQENVDYVVVGEGEITLYELLEAIVNDTPKEIINGLAFKKDNTVIMTPPRTRIKNLDSLPLPKREERFLHYRAKYSIHYPAARLQKGCAKVAFGRGCPYGCSFCQAKNLLGKEIYWRSPKLVVDEIEMLIDKFGIDYAVFLDLTFNFNEKKVIDLCNEFIARDLPIHWGVNVRADILTEKQLIAMKKAKCSKICVGIESPIPKYAKQLKGKYKIDQIHLEHILKFANDLGLLIRTYLIIGLPHETKEMILSYPEALHNLIFDEILIAFATPLPGTEFFDECINKGLIAHPLAWQDFMMDKPTFATKHFTKEQIILLHAKIYQKTYFHESYLKHVKNKLSKFPHLANSWLDHFEGAKDYNFNIGFEKEFQQLMDIIQGTIS